MSWFTKLFESPVYKCIKCSKPLEEHRVKHLTLYLCTNPACYRYLLFSGVKS